MSSFVSVGNKADVSGNDLLAYWSDDPAHRRDRALPGELRQPAEVRAARARGRRGASRSSPSRPAARPPAAARRPATPPRWPASTSRWTRSSSRRGSSAPTRSRTCSTWWRCSPRSRCRGAARRRRDQRRAGPGSSWPTRARRRGLTLPELSADTVASLRAFLPPAASVRNPVDMLAAAQPDALRRARSRRWARIPTVDAVVVIYVPPLAIDSDEVAAAIARGAGAGARPDKPVASRVPLVARARLPRSRRGPARPAALLQLPRERGPRAGRGRQYGRWRERPRGRRRRSSATRARRCGRSCDRVLAADESARWLEAKDLEAVLRAAGIAVADVAGRAARGCTPRRRADRAIRWWPRRSRPACSTRATSAASSSGWSRRKRSPPP